MMCFGAQVGGQWHKKSLIWLLWKVNLQLLTVAGPGASLLNGGHLPTTTGWLQGVQFK